MYTNTIAINNNDNKQKLALFNLNHNYFQTYIA